MAISRAIRLVSPLCSSLALSLVACRPATSASPPATTRPTAALAGLDAPTGSGQSGAQAGSGGPHGVLDKDDIRKVVRAGIADVRACYNAGLDNDPKLTGRVEIQFTIVSDGKVGQVAVQESTLPAWARSVADCVAAVAGRWQFPPPEGGGTVTVLYPFVLEPG